MEFTKSLDIEYEVIDCDADEYEVIDCDADEHHEEILKPEDPAEPETVEAFRAASTVSADVQRRIDQRRGHRSGEESNHPTDEAGPKPVGRLTEVVERESAAHRGEDESQSFLNTVFDEEVEVNAGHGKSVDEQIWQAIAQGKLSKRKAKHLRRLLARLRDEYIEASANGEDIEVFIRRVTTEAIEEDGLNSLCPFASNEKDEGLIGEG